LDSLTAQDVEHTLWFAEVAPLAPSNWKDCKVDWTPGEHVMREVRITYRSVDPLDTSLL